MDYNNTYAERLLLRIAIRRYIRIHGITFEQLSLLLRHWDGVDVDHVKKPDINMISASRKPLAGAFYVSRKTISELVSDLDATYLKARSILHRCMVLAGIIDNDFVRHESLCLIPDYHGGATETLKHQLGSLIGDWVWLQFSTAERDKFICSEFSVEPTRKWSYAPCSEMIYHERGVQYNGAAFFDSLRNLNVQMRERDTFYPKIAIFSFFDIFSLSEPMNLCRGILIAGSRLKTTHVTRVELRRKQDEWDKVGQGIMSPDQLRSLSESSYNYLYKDIKPGSFQT